MLLLLLFIDESFTKSRLKEGKEERKEGRKERRK